VKGAGAVLLAIVGVVAGCGHPAPPFERPPVRLTFLADLDYRPAGAPIPRVGGSPVAELSGLAYDAAAGELVAAVDDGEPTRLYRFPFVVGPGSLRLGAPREVRLRSADGGPPTEALDVEGVALSARPGGGDGVYILAVEGRDRAVPNGTRFRSTCGLLTVASDISISSV
jgi:hypothetical protein